MRLSAPRCPPGAHRCAWQRQVTARGRGGQAQCSEEVGRAGRHDTTPEGIYDQQVTKGMGGWGGGR